MSSLVTAGWKVLPLAKLAANSKEAGLTRTVVFLAPPNEFRNKAYAIAGRIVPPIELRPFIEACEVHWANERMRWITIELIVLWEK